MDVGPTSASAKSAINRAPGRTGEESPLAELRGVTVKLGDRMVLTEVSAEIWAGEFIGVIGPNGAGKTTLLRVLLGLLRPLYGDVKILAQGLHHGSPHVGYCPQILSFDRDLPITGQDFVGLGIDGHRWGLGLPSRHRQELIDEMLCSAGAADYADAPIGQLSGGEQQRLAIAQALISEPRLLLLDEPLASLDLRSQGEIVALVDRLRRERNIAVLFVTHSVNPLLEVLDRVWYLAGGRAAIGSVREVIRPDVLSRLYGSPVEVVEAKGRIFVIGGEE